MIKIMFVCHGNICRSPMAELIMKKLVSEAGMSDSVYIESSATSTEEIGNPVYPPAKKVLLQHGIPCDGKRARQIIPSDYDSFNYIIAMEKYNLKRLSERPGKYRDDPDNKIKLLLDFSNTPGDISDPWYNDNFDKTYDEILYGCQSLLTYIKNNANY